MVKRLAAAGALAALLAFGLALAGSSADGADDRQVAAVKRTIKKAVLAAVRDHNYERACRFGTQEGRRRLLEGYNSSQYVEYPDCPAILRDEVRHAPLLAKRLRQHLVIRKVRIDGGRARAEVAEGSGEYAGSGHVVLVKRKGRWRLHNSDLIPYGD